MAEGAAAAQVLVIKGKAGAANDNAITGCETNNV